MEALAAHVQQRRRTLPNGVAYWLAAGVIGLGLFASLTPSPLYRTYSVLWHFSPLTLTLIYATYAFGVLTTLVLAGGVSDHVGRRPVLLASLGGLIGTLLTIPIAKYFGRKKMFFVYYLAAAASIMATFGLAMDPHTRLYMYFAIGLTVFGVFGSFTYYLPELFPTRLRATGAGRGNREHAGAWAIPPA